jgi:hypothetical protein
MYVDPTSITSLSQTWLHKDGWLRLLAGHVAGHGRLPLILEVVPRLCQFVVTVVASNTVFLSVAVCLSQHHCLPALHLLFEMC